MKYEDYMNEVDDAEETEVSPEEYGSLDSEEFGGAETFGEEASNPQTGREEVLGSVKKAVPILVVALVVICVAIGALGRHNSSSKNQGSSSKENAGSSVVVKETTVAQTTPTTGSVSVKEPSSSSKDEWVWVNDKTNLTFSEPINSIFTVTDIKLVGKSVDVENVFQLDSIVYGSIDGLRGTYEARIPYSTAVNIKVGTQINMKYRMGEVDGVKFISSITF